MNVLVVYDHPPDTGEPEVYPFSLTSEMLHLTKWLAGHKEEAMWKIHELEYVHPKLTAERFGRCPICKPDEEEE